MYILDILLATGAILGLYLSILFCLGYFRERAAKALVLALMSIVLTCASIAVLVAYGSDIVSGDTSPLTLAICIPLLILFIYSLIASFLKRSRRDGR
jgi:K+ transporter